MSATSWEAIVERRRLATRSERPWKPKVYAPSIRSDQLKALYYLKELERRPMTKLLQEALDRYLEPHGGVDGLIARGIAELGDRSAEACRRCGGR
jgi:hypothetical protein